MRRISEFCDKYCHVLRIGLKMSTFTWNTYTFVSELESKKHTLLLLMLNISSYYLSSAKIVVLLYTLVLILTHTDRTQNVYYVSTPFLSIVLFAVKEYDQLT